MDNFHLLKPAARTNGGYVKDNRVPFKKIVAPEVLTPRVLMFLSPEQKAKMAEITRRKLEVEQDMRSFIDGLGLDAKGKHQYVFHDSGAVTERTVYRPFY